MRYHFRKSHISKLDPFLMVIRDFALLGVIIVWNEVFAVRRATRGVGQIFDILGFQTRDVAKSSKPPPRNDRPARAPRLWLP